MARGFESKDVEYQQAEAARATTRQGLATVEERTRAARRRELELSLVRMRSDLARARVGAHRVMVERAIATLESDLASLS